MREKFQNYVTAWLARARNTAQRTRAISAQFVDLMGVMDDGRADSATTTGDDWCVN